MKTRLHKSGTPRLTRRPSAIPFTPAPQVDRADVLMFAAAVRQEALELPQYTYVGPLTHGDLRKIAADSTQDVLIDLGKGTPWCDLRLCGCQIWMNPACPEGGFYRCDDFGPPTTKWTRIGA